MSRLEFGPKPAEMEVTDITTGHFVFRPVPQKHVSYRELDEAIENAGYEIDEAEITVSGHLTAEGQIKTPEGQLFHLEVEDEGVRQSLAEMEPGEEIAVNGAWETVEGVEVVTVAEIQRAEAR